MYLQNTGELCFTIKKREQLVFEVSKTKRIHTTAEAIVYSAQWWTEISSLGEASNCDVQVSMRHLRQNTLTSDVEIWWE